VEEELRPGAFSMWERLAEPASKTAALVSQVNLFGVCLMPGGETEGYELVRCLRSDSYSELFEGTQPRRHDRRFLLEIFDGTSSDDPGWAAFERDRLAASALEHPAVLRTTEIGSLPNGTPLVVMEYGGGETLATWLERHDTPQVDEAIAFIRALAEGLAAAHDQGLAHGDIRPEQVMVAERPECTLGAPRLMGFGARWLRPEDTLIHYGEPSGPVDGLSPEERAADMRALALLAERMLTPSELRGVSGFTGRGFGTGPEVHAVIARAMGERPTSRFSSVMDLTEELEQAVANDGAVTMRAWDDDADHALSWDEAPAVAPLGRLLGRLRPVHGVVGAAAAALVAAVGFGAIRVSTVSAGHAVVSPPIAMVPEPASEPEVSPPAAEPAVEPAPSADPAPAANLAPPAKVAPARKAAPARAPRGVVWSAREQRLVTPEQAAADPLPASAAEPSADDPAPAEDPSESAVLSDPAIP
jgi:hypothetical protein